MRSDSPLSDLLSMFCKFLLVPIQMYAYILYKYGSIFYKEMSLLLLEQKSVSKSQTDSIGVKVHTCYVADPVLILSITWSTENCLA